MTIAVLGIIGYTEGTRNYAVVALGICQKKAAVFSGQSTGKDLAKLVGTLYVAGIHPMAKGAYFDLTDAQLNELCAFSGRELAKVNGSLAETMERIQAEILGRK